MADAYIYSASRIRALEGSGYLLSSAQTERLLNTEGIEEFFAALQETFLGPYLERAGREQFAVALEKALQDTRHVLGQIAPEPELLNILWHRYDFANLKIILKSIRKDVFDETILDACYATGKYEPAALLEAVRKEKTKFLPMEASEAIERSRNTEELYLIDAIIDEAYIKLARRLAQGSSWPFIEKYCALHAEFFALKSKLRAANLEGYVQLSSMGASDRGADGGEKALDEMVKLGGEAMWRDAVREYQEEGHFTLLEKTFEDYMLRFVRWESVGDLFSPATLFAFFEMRKNDIKTIRSIYVFKATGGRREFAARVARSALVS